MILRVKAALRIRGSRMWDPSRRLLHRSGRLLVHCPGCGHRLRPRSTLRALPDWGCPWRPASERWFHTAAYGARRFRPARARDDLCVFIPRAPQSRAVYPEESWAWRSAPAWSKLITSGSELYAASMRAVEPISSRPRIGPASSMEITSGEAFMRLARMRALLSASSLALTGVFASRSKSITADAFSSERADISAVDPHSLAVTSAPASSRI